MPKMLIEREVVGAALNFLYKLHPETMPAPEAVMEEAAAVASLLEDAREAADAEDN